MSPAREDGMHGLRPENRWQLSERQRMLVGAAPRTEQPRKGRQHAWAPTPEPAAAPRASTHVSGPRPQNRELVREATVLSGGHRPKKRRLHLLAIASRPPSHGCLRDLSQYPSFPCPPRRNSVAAPRASLRGHVHADGQCCMHNNPFFELRWPVTKGRPGGAVGAERHVGVS